MWPLFAAILIAGLSTPAAAHDGMDALSRFYAGWMRPDNRLLSCCNKTDCHSTTIKREGGSLWAKNSAGVWIIVPQEAIETEPEQDNPNGENHICERMINDVQYVFCFQYGGGT